MTHNKRVLFYNEETGEISGYIVKVETPAKQQTIEDKERAEFCAKVAEYLDNVFFGNRKQNGRKG